MTEKLPNTYANRERYSCDVCWNVPNEYGELEHERDCYIINEDGGGSSWVEMDDIEPVENP